MAEFDVRGSDESTITTIRVAEHSATEYVVDVIVMSPYEDVLLKDSRDGRALTISSSEHAQNLIKGIQKAIDLGWLN